jgi:hypothetical protein
VLARAANSADTYTRAGRTDEQKKSLYAKVAELASKYADT